jgi:hypothetical protein
MMSIIIYIFYIIHNTQLGYDYNYVNLITYLHHVEKITHIKCKMMEINFSHHILNNIIICLLGGCITKFF